MKMDVLKPSLLDVIFISLLASWSIATESSSVSPSPTINGSVVAATRNASSSTPSLNATSTSLSPAINGTSIVQVPSSSSSGYSANPSSVSSLTSPSGGLSSVVTGLSKILENLTPEQKKLVLDFDEKRKDAVSKMTMKTDVKPRETAGEDNKFTSVFEKLFSDAQDLGNQLAPQSDVRLNYSVITEANAVLVKKFDCLKERLSRFPLTVNPRSNGAVANVIRLPLECPQIVEAPIRRTRRDVQLSVEVDLDVLPMVDDVPLEYVHFYHYQRTRRAALDSQDVCLQSLDDRCLNTRLNVTLKIKNLNFTSEYGNTESSAYKTLKEDITTTLTANITAHNKDWHIKPHSFQFRAGSVIADFYIDHNDGAWPGLKTYLLGFGSSLGSFNIDPFAVNKIDVVNGGWSNYSAWHSTTPVTFNNCGEKFQVKRTRSCSNPPPKNGGKSCTGPKEETKPCECGGKLVNTGGTIFSPYWPDNKYPSNANCTWFLEAPFNHTIELRITDFHLETDKKCFYDYVQIFDGNSTSATELMSRTCGSRGLNRTIKSTDRFMTVRFRSDNSVTYKGFKATWSKVVKPWKPPKPIQYKEQNVTVTNVISCPTYNNSFVPLGKATTCSSSSLASTCYFETPVYLISCLIGVSTNRADLSLDSSSSLNFTFKHIMHKELFPSYYLMEKTCVTWDTTSSKGSNAWSKKGCFVETTNLTHTTCQCDHTGIFAVLVTEKVENDKEFSLLANTYAGIGVAFAIIIVSILHIVWKVDIHGGEVMRINICVAIMLMMLTFLIGANVKAQKSLCGFLTFLEYFSVLAQYFWLMLHGMRIHGKIKELFASGMNIEIVYVVFGWGLPLLLSLISIGIQVDIKNPSAVCWTAIAGGGMWGYGAPLLIVILLNISIIGAIVVPTEERKTKYHYEPMLYRALKDTCLIALFTVTFIAAYCTVDQKTFKAQYFLSASVVLQAVAMFVFGREGRKDFVKRDKDKKVENDIFSQNTNEEVFDKFDDESSSRSSRQSYVLDKSPERKVTTKLKNGKERETSVDA